MKVLVLEQDDDFREDLLLRIEEALKLSLLRGVSVVGRSLIEAGSESPDLIFLSFLDEVDYIEVVGRVSAMFPEAEIVLMVPSEQYVEEAVELRRKTSLRVVAVGDIPQVAQIFLDLDGVKSGVFGQSVGKLISIVHVSGGVGASSIALSLAQRFAQRDLSTLLFDIDYVRQTLARWASYGVLERREFSALVDSNINITLEKVRAIIQQVPTGNPMFGFIGSLDSFVRSNNFFGSGVGYGTDGLERFELLILELVRAYDSLVVDLGNLWGVGALTTLSLSSKVVLVLPEDRSKFRADLEFLQRMSSESDDPLEFDFSKWQPIVVGRSNKPVAPELEHELTDFGLFPKKSNLQFLPFQKSASSWFEAGQSGVSQVDKNFDMQILELAKLIFPRRFS